MPISENDIKLLASAALNDTAEGGGAMTGNIVVDGQDNNLFPDISEGDWAYGRVQLRQVYGVAHTSDTDTLLGAHAFIADAPDDPGVKVALFQTSGWGDTREVAKAAIEQYMLQGPKITPVVRDNHYAGSKTLQLYIAGTAIFPAAGDCILIQNPAPDAKEQYVRVVGVKMSVETVNDGNGSYAINIGTLTLADALEFDLLGLPLSRALQSDAGKTKIYGTTQSSGTPFYGIKKLAADGTVGAISVNVADGIYTNLVPSSTVEVPLVDQYPLVNNSGLGASGMATISISQNVIFKASTKLTMPTAITPGSVNLSYYYGTYIFNDKDGNLMINSVAVGTVNYAAGTITLFESAPTYQNYDSPMVCTYLPAASGSAAALSDYLTITQANVGLVFTRILRPAPLRGSLKISYMSLGKWYDLFDNSTGKIAGADSSYGVGSINYDTGSLSLTLGALPDIGSPIILQWCRKNAIAKFTPPSITDLPTKAGADIALPANINPSSIVLEFKSIRMDWGGGPITVSRRATVNDKNEVWMYDTDGPYIYPQSGASLMRCGQVVGSTLRLEPGNFPTTDIAMAYGIYTYGATAYTQDATTGTITLSTAPVQPGTVHLSLLPMLPSGGTDTLLDTTTALALYDNGAGVLFVMQPGSTTSIAAATVDYTTGIVTLTPTARVVLPATRVTMINESSWLGLINWDVKDTQLVKVDAFLKVVKTCIYSGSSAVANTTATVLKNTLTWSVRVPLPNAKIVESALTYAMPLKASGAAFTMGDNLFTAYGALLRKGWDISTAQATVAQAGTVGADGLIVLSSLPDNGVNAIAWQNLPVESGDVTIKHAIFRTASAPLKEGIFDIRFTDPSADGLGSYTLDAQRGWAIVRNQVAFRPAEFSYAAVALSYLPLKASLLGLSTARLPLDGKVPVFHAGDLVVVHNTLSTQLVNPVAKNTPYNIGRQRIASVRVRDALGALVGSSMYTTDLDAGTIKFSTSADLTPFAQPFTVQHRIQDLSVCLDVDLSGKISLNRSLTHAYPADSYVSSCIYAGDLFARASNFFEQQAWTNAWANVVSGNATLAQFNSADYPLTMTNRGTITERWALIFTSTTQFRVIGEKVGQIGVGDINAICAPNNPATQAAYFSVDPLAWGLGWAAGNVVRFNTYACGTPIWIARTVLQGTPTLQSDSFTLAWRGDVNA